MTTKYKIKRVREVIRTFKDLERLYSKCEAVLGVNPESPFFKTTYGLFTKYLDCVSREIGDQSSWLRWYVWDNDCGERKGLVTWRREGQEHSVNVGTPAQLVQVMEGHG